MRKKNENGITFGNERSVPQLYQCSFFDTHFPGFYRLAVSRNVQAEDKKERKKDFVRHDHFRSKFMLQLFMSVFDEIIIPLGINFYTNPE
jgi:hypothetical protein